MPGLIALTRFDAASHAMFLRSLARGEPAYNTMVEAGALREHAARAGGRLDVYVLEMLIDADRIGGVGLLRFDAARHPLRRWGAKPPLRVYERPYQHYNNYAYPIAARVDRDAAAAALGERLVEIEASLMRGKRHAKRGTGITLRQPRDPDGLSRGRAVGEVAALFA